MLQIRDVTRNSRDMYIINTLFLHHDNEHWMVARIHNNYGGSKQLWALLLLILMFLQT